MSYDIFWKLYIQFNHLCTKFPNTEQQLLTVCYSEQSISLLGDFILNKSQLVHYSGTERLDNRYMGSRNAVRTRNATNVYWNNRGSPMLQTQAHSPFLPSLPRTMYSEKHIPIFSWPSSFHVSTGTVPTQDSIPAPCHFSSEEAKQLVLKSLRWHGKHVLKHKNWTTCNNFVSMGRGSHNF